MDLEAPIRSITFPNGKYTFWIVSQKGKRSDFGTLIRVHESSSVEERAKKLFTDEGTKYDPRIVGLGEYTKRRSATRAQIFEWLRFHPSEEDTPTDFPIPKIRYRMRCLRRGNQFIGNLLEFEDGRKAVRLWYSWPWYFWTHCDRWVSPKIVGEAMMSPYFRKFIKKRVKSGLSPSKLRALRYKRRGYDLDDEVVV